MRGPHRLIAGVFVLAVLTIGYFFWFKPHQESDKPIHISTASQPTLSKGEGVSLVIFEEPLCPHCLELNLEVMPNVKSQFVDSRKISYTVIPVSFLPHSMPIAEAWLAVYYSQTPPSSEDFFTYLAAFYSAQKERALHGPKTPWSVKELSDLLQKALPSVGLSKFTQDLHSGVYASKIQKNTQNADHTLPTGLITPGIYINGVRVTQWRDGKLVQAIEKALAPTTQPQKEKSS